MPTITLKEHKLTIWLAQSSRSRENYTLTRRTWLEISTFLYTLPRVTFLSLTPPVWFCGARRGKRYPGCRRFHFPCSNWVNNRNFELCQGVNNLLCAVYNVAPRHHRHHFSLSKASAYDTLKWYDWHYVTKVIFEAVRSKNMNPFIKGKELFCMQPG